MQTQLNRTATSLTLGPTTRLQPNPGLSADLLNLWALTDSTPQPLPAPGNDIGVDHRFEDVLRERLDTDGAPAASRASDEAPRDRRTEPVAAAAERSPDTRRDAPDPERDAPAPDRPTEPTRTARNVEREPAEGDRNRPAESSIAAEPTKEVPPAAAPTAASPAEATVVAAVTIQATLAGQGRATQSQIATSTQTPKTPNSQTTQATGAEVNLKLDAQVSTPATLAGPEATAHGTDAAPRRSIAAAATPATPTAKATDPAPASLETAAAEGTKATPRPQLLVTNALSTGGAATTHSLRTTASVAAPSAPSSDTLTEAGATTATTAQPVTTALHATFATGTLNARAQASAKGLSAVSRSATVATADTGTVADTVPEVTAVGGALGTGATGPRSAGAPMGTASTPAAKPMPLANQVAESIQTAVRNNEREVVVQLNPPTLGRITLRFRQEGDHLVGLVEVSHRQVRADLEQALPQVLQHLEQNGTQVRRLEVQLQDDPGAGQAHRDDAGRQPGDPQTPERQDSQGDPDTPRRQINPRDEAPYAAEDAHPGDGRVNLLL